jgi:HlyD family secretion protein
MDIKREGVADKKRKKRILYGAAGLLGIVFVTVGLSRLKPAAPSVDEATVWRGTVERGSMVRNVRGSGNLVPDENSIRWIPAETNGRVERIRAKAGAVVTPSTIILEMSNPTAQQELLDAINAQKRADAELAQLRVQLISQLMQQQANAAQIESDFLQATLQAERDKELLEAGIGADLNYKLSQARANSLAVRNDIEKERLRIAEQSNEAQLDAKLAEVEQRRDFYRLRKRMVNSLTVRAGIAGILQEVPVEVGQQLAPGANLARVVAEDARLKAEINVAATQARDVAIGQKAEVDTRNGIIQGVVSRIDPSVQNGLVTVDVDLIGEMPPGARVDLNVDGTIELERLEDTLYVGRPAFGQEKSTVGLFVMEEDGVHASRRQVKLGRSSVTYMEVLDGLAEGNVVVLSDTSQWDQYDRIRLN